MSNLTLNAPINGLSFGAVSVGILRDLFKREMAPNMFPIGGQVDLAAQKPDEAFNRSLSQSIEHAQAAHRRGNPVYRLWHISGSLESYANAGNRLITFFELDSLTPTEINILKQQERVYVTSTYTRDVFAMFGIESTYLPLGFDSHNFVQLATRPLIDGVTTFLMGGKLEKRKGHLKTLGLWAKKYGGNMKYRLNAALHNPFMRPEHQQQLITQALDGKTYPNINFLPHMATNAEYNSFLQSGQIYLAMSGGEGKDLPAYHATALGAWPVALNAHAYKDYLTADNAVLVNPNSKVPAADGLFFASNGQFNVGNIFDFDANEFIAACESAEQKAAQGLNVKGLDLQNVTYAQTVDALLT